MNKYIQIGTIVAAHGWHGQVILVHQLGKQATGDNIPVLFIEKNINNFIPYFIESIQEVKDGEVFLKLESIDSKEDARSLLKKKVCLDRDSFRTLIQPDSHLYYIGFTLIDKKEKTLGKIADVTQLPGQLIAHVHEKGKELLIPLTEQTIDKTDRKEQIIYVTLPDGLLDIYRGEDTGSE